MGVVKSLITGQDGCHRGAFVKLRSGDRVVEMSRPLNRLYPVEVESQVREERRLKKACRAFSFKCSSARVKFPVGVERVPK